MFSEMAQHRVCSRFFDYVFITNVNNFYFVYIETVFSGGSHNWKGSTRDWPAITILSIVAKPGYFVIGENGAKSE